VCLHYIEYTFLSSVVCILLCKSRSPFISFFVVYIDFYVIYITSSFFYSTLSVFFHMFSLWYVCSHWHVMRDPFFWFHIKYHFYAYIFCIKYLSLLFAKINHYSCFLTVNRFIVTKISWKNNPMEGYGFYCYMIFIAVFDYGRFNSFFLYACRNLERLIPNSPQNLLINCLLFGVLWIIGMMCITLHIMVIYFI
jgi:hypothetical protein